MDADKKKSGNLRTSAESADKIVVEIQGLDVYDSTTSRPFDRPATGKIAVKVINHYGDEVLKVYKIG